jgi:hypothetical protein
MRVFHPGAFLTGRRVDFLDATEEEVLDLVRSMVSELAIMSCFLAMPPEQKKAVQASIASFEACLGNGRQKH